MTDIHFALTARSDKHHRSFPAEAMKFWREHGTILGELLHRDSPLTFPEIVIACQEYVLQDPQASLLPFLDETHVAWCLIKLLEFGMIEPVLASASPSQPGDQGETNHLRFSHSSDEKETEGMAKIGIPVTLVNLFTRRHLAKVELDTLPSSGDVIYWRGLGYEVENREWTIHADESVDIVVALRLQADEYGRRPFSHPGENQ